MVIPLFSVVALLFFSPSFSDPCPPAMPSNTSNFKIQYPFCVYNDSCLDCDDLDLSKVGCMDTGPRSRCGAPIEIIRCNRNDDLIKLVGLDHWLQVENISSGDCTLIARDHYLGHSLLHSNCTNAKIVFEPPIDVNSEKFSKEYELFSSIQCDPKTQRIANGFCESHGWNCTYPVKEMNSPSPVLCSDPPHNFSFILTFSFNNQRGDVTLLSASFSDAISLLPDCIPRHKALQECESPPMHQG